LAPIEARRRHVATTAARAAAAAARTAAAHAAAAAASSSAAAAAASASANTSQPSGGGFSFNLFGLEISFNRSAAADAANAVATPPPFPPPDAVFAPSPPRAYP